MCNVHRKDNRKDNFMLHATTTGVNPFRSWAAVKQVFYDETILQMDEPNQLQNMPQAKEHK
jgi:hypothetical protein